MVDTNTSWEGQDMRSCRKFQAKHLNEGGLKEKGICYEERSHTVWSKRGKRQEVWNKREKTQKTAQ